MVKQQKNNNIEDENSNSSSKKLITFKKRSKNLIRKAEQLSILCDADVSLFGFSSIGTAFEFSSSSIDSTLSRFEKCLHSPKKSALEQKPEVVYKTSHGQTNEELNLMHKAEESDILKEQITRLKQKELQLLGKDLHRGDVEELQHLIQQLNDALLSVNDKREEILIKQIEQSRLKEHQAILENETLRKQVEQLQGFLCPPKQAELRSIGCYPLINNSHDRDAPGHPDTICENGVEIGDSEITLELGL